MNMPSDDIKSLLVDESSLDLTFGTNLFIGKEPSSPDNTVTIYDTGGEPPDLIFSGNSGYERPSVQIRVRNNKYEMGWELINDIKNTLHGLGPIIIDNTTYTLIECVFDPSFLVRDENDRVIFVTTIDMQRI